MSERVENRINRESEAKLDFEAYKLLLALWSGENPIKTNKLQVLLVVNALLVSALSFSGGFTSENWFVYAAGMTFNLIWTFSIGRTALFQEVWQMKLKELERRYAGDVRFSILETAGRKGQAPAILRAFGCIPSKWYLLLSPSGFAILWLVVLVVTLVRG